MRKNISIAVLVLITVSAVSFSFAQKKGNEPAAVTTARGVLQRLIGSRTNDFRLSLMSSGGATDSYEISAAKGIVTVRGTSTVALTRGCYDYLRSSGIGMVTWSGARIDLPKTFPDMTARRDTSPFRFRQYYNVCTFGYTTVWWDWQRWERELDWMALHGITMPLAMVGQEFIWSRVWKQYGMTRADLDEFFTGPAFLPWQRMGNVNKHGGPLTDEWMEQQRQLQHKILRRMRDLGMTPIAPAFSGFVPPAFQRAHRDIGILENSHWGNFPDGYQTYVLPPNSPLFAQIGAAFIKEYEKEFGSFEYYLADTFNELNVPVHPDRRYDELAAFGRAVYGSITAAKPSAVWVLQGWMFGNDRSFWDKPSVAALLRDVPNDKVMVLDLCHEFYKGYKEQDAFYGKRWIASVIHNFGGNNPLYGDMNFFARQFSSVVKDSARGSLDGIGLAPEGVENNEVIYELLTDAAWKTEPVDVQQWIPQYLHGRYRSVSPNILHAWELLQHHVYTGSSLNFKHAFQSRPSSAASSNIKDTVGLREIAESFLADAPQHKNDPLYNNDLVEVTAQYAGTVIDRKFREAIQAHEAGDGVLRDSLASEGLAMLSSLDGLLDTRPDLRLDRWVRAARANSAAAEGKAQLEENARTQVTIWGGPDLYDYASKVWSGLVKDFYAERWRLYFDLLKNGTEETKITAALVRWEEEWTKKSVPPADRPAGDAVAAARALMTSLDASLHLVPSPRIDAERPVVVRGDSVRITITAPMPGATVRYTTDGSEPTEKSNCVGSPFFVYGTAVIKAKAFVPGLTPSLTVMASVGQVEKGNGIRCSYYAKAVSSLADTTLRSAVPSKTMDLYTFDITAIGPSADDYVEIFETQFDVTESGEYIFYTESDDGSRLFVDGHLVVDNDGYHARREVRGSIRLEKGKHPVRVEFFEARGAEYLRVRYTGPGIKKQNIAAQRLFLPDRPR